MTTDARYPVGKFHKLESYTDATRSAAITAIAALPANLRKAVAGLTEAQLDTPYRDGGWSLRQVVHHLADSHANAYIRTRFTLTSVKPTIMPYPENVWAELFDAKSGPAEASLAILDGMHARWAMLLKSLNADAFARAFVHPEHGERTLDWMVEMYAWHSKHHAAHITELRKAKGW
ncbi:MAG: putative metal-dependent hydrolase [Gemmatimonadetes bacterium]|nr:putative metal-dependent hydrolase [Gemmatimonadota bacterium]